MVRCNHCKTKKLVIYFTCKCEYNNLCIKCRIPNSHNCTYDYNKEWKCSLEKALPLIVADKMNKI
jgi:hypothetical protein